MVNLTKKQNRIAISIWLFIGIILVFSNNVIAFLGNLGIESGTANIGIIFLAVILAYYHANIAKQLSGVI